MKITGIIKYEVQVSKFWAVQSIQTGDNSRRVETCLKEPQKPVTHAVYNESKRK